MKALKKTIVAVVILAILGAILVPFVIAPIANNIKLAEYDDEVVGKPLPSKVTIKQASYSEYGHLGASEDIEYFTSIVITTDVSFEVLTQHYAGCVVLPLTSATIQPEGMNKSITYSAIQDRTEFNNYYVIYKYVPADTGEIMGWIANCDKTV